jgi:hypothetical protein
MTTRETHRVTLNAGVVLGGLIALAVIVSAIPTPIPGFTILGAEVTATWQKLALGPWAVAVLIATAYLGLGMFRRAKKGPYSSCCGGMSRHEHCQMLNAAITLGGLIALAVIVGVFITIFGS